MRRLATQTRGGSVQSNRDYQIISDLGFPVLWSPVAKEKCCLEITFRASKKSGIIGAVAAYVAATKDTQLSIVVLDGKKRVIVSRFVALDSRLHWNRFGVAWLGRGFSKAKYTVRFMWDSNSKISVWGLSCDNLRLPKHIRPDVANDPAFLLNLNKPHLSPEAFYLPHSSAIVGRHSVVYKNIKSSLDRRYNPGKKCSQCQRRLPVDPRLSKARKATLTIKRAPHAMVLAFHGHRAKLSGYQNECRACKKFEINDHFNPIRTSDQLNESSVLTRERKLFLRETEILKQFKNRNNKRGLRYAIWKRFGGRCFKCRIKISVSDYELDHTRPLAYLWPIDKHATLLCASCNNQKSDHFPVDFYSRSELKRLSRITGLSYPLLIARDMNQEQLKRIRANLSVFAKEWSFRLFYSVATRVKETNPHIDLFAELKAANLSAYKSIITSLKIRPASISI